MRNLFRIAIPFVLGGAVTAALWSASDRHEAPAAGVAQADAESQVWTCSMHPQIRMNEPGICPLCGMDLTPVRSDQDPWEAVDPATRLVLSESARRMARVETVEVARRALSKDLRTVGRVEFDETRVAYIAARVGGRVDRVYADFPGTLVRQGEHLVQIYSPELLSTQQEFLTALRSEQSAPQNLGLGGLSQASRRRLLLWGVTEDQINALAKSGQTEEHLVVYAPRGGTVIEKNVRPGQYVKEGDPLYTIADLGRVWLVLDVYESELSWIRVGQKVEVTLESEPHQPLEGTVAFIEPVLTNVSRSVRVRVIVDNPNLRLKPGMYAQASIQVPLLSGGRPAPTGLEGKYACPMHPYEVADQPGLCRICNMPLELVPRTETEGRLTTASIAAEKADEVLAVPAEAVLTTGERQLLYVEKEPGKYQLVEPKLGPRAGDYYPVLEGLAAGDKVVARGGFLLDSQYQITGRTSLLHPHDPAGPQGNAVVAGALSAEERANIDKLSPEDREVALRQKICPITELNLGSMGMPYKLVVEGRSLFLCCQGCEGQVKADPAAALRKIDAAANSASDAPPAAASHGGSHG